MERAQGRPRAAIAVGTRIGAIAPRAWAYAAGGTAAMVLLQALWPLCVEPEGAVMAGGIFQALWWTPVWAAVAACSAFVGFLAAPPMSLLRHGDALVLGLMSAVPWNFAAWSLCGALGYGGVVALDVTMGSLVAAAGSGALRSLLAEP